VEAVWVFLLGSMVNHNMCVGDCSVLWDFANVSVMVTTERREWDARPGMIWAARAPAGRSGRSRVQV
jgi:hypothetical protein